mmetsp:Transcript_75887/g.197657  ORF Transcript_75887/g.197657 Transcript_75887/m.197657 type:complete len:260 (-) Transcript_75887:367-1146(-)
MVSVPVTEVDRTAGGTCTPLLPMSAVPRVVTKLPTLLEEVVADLSSLACLTVVPCRCKGCIPTRRGAAGIAAAKAAACICACCSMHPSSTRNSWMRWSRAAQAACPAACVSSGPPGLHPQLVPPPRPPVLPMPPPPPPLLPLPRWLSWRTPWNRSSPRAPLSPWCCCGAPAAGVEMRKSCLAWAKRQDGPSAQSPRLMSEGHMRVLKKSGKGTNSPRPCAKVQLSRRAQMPTMWNLQSLVRKKTSTSSPSSGPGTAGGG